MQYLFSFFLLFPIDFLKIIIHLFLHTYNECMRKNILLSKLLARIRRRDIPFILISAILGTINHFLYDYSDKNPVTGLFTPINESVWEHMKLLFFPFLFASVIQFFIQKPNRNPFWGGRLIGIWTSILSVIFLHYGYSGLLGTHFAVIDILLFYIGVLIAFISAAKSGKYFRNTDILKVFWGWALSALLFFILTCYHPEFPLFLPPEM